jgi:hypothetical protein
VDRGGAPALENTMFRSTQLRFAAILLFAAAAISLTAAPARAFSQGNAGTVEGGNSSFADPDEQINIFGYGFDQNAQPSALGSMQAVPKNLTPFKHFQTDSLTSPPNPLSRPSN